jgi:hypothetical protein
MMRMWGWVKIRWAMIVKHKRIKFRPFKTNLKALAKNKKREGWVWKEERNGEKRIVCKKSGSPRGVAWWQRTWDLHSRSRVRVRACTSCKSLEQPGFYLLIWAHKMRFPEGGVSSNPKKKKGVRKVEK